jgi:integrase
MAVFRPPYKDKKTGEQRTGNVWWYEFVFAGRRIRESAKTTRKTIAKEAEKKRHLELEQGFNAVEDTRGERIRTLRELATEYLESYKVRHRSATFAQYALGHVMRLVGSQMVVDINEQVVKDYQTARLKEQASPKTINEEVGFLLRVLGDQGDTIRARLRRQKALKLRTASAVGKAYTPEQKTAMLSAARAAKSPAVYPALMLALNAGMRDAEIRNLRWDRVDLLREFLAVGDSKTEAGEGRTIPLNSSLLLALKDYTKWYTHRFGTIRPEWFVFPWGKPRPSDPTRPMVTLKTAWGNVRKKAGLTGRWHDNRHTFITELAESGVPDEVIRDLAGHVSKQMLRHYSHIRMEAKRKALEGLVQKRSNERTIPESNEISTGVPQEVPKVAVVN